MTHKQAALLALALFTALCLFRSLVSGWGPPDLPTDAAWVPIGVADFPADNLSYVTWPQQAMRDGWLFVDLYTTTEHPPALFNLLFLVVGKLAWLTGAHPLTVLNVIGALALPLFVFGFNAVCRTLSLGAGASFAATCLALGGGGISWVRRLITFAGVDRILPVGPTGPDFSYFDLYPAAAYFVYPSHALSLAILTLLVLAIVRCDDERPLRAGRVAGLVGMGLLFSWIRPYEPVAILTAMTTVVAAGVLLRLPAALTRRRLTILGLLAAGLLPQILYGLWFSTLPVWGNATKTSFDLAVEGDWASGYLVLWVLALLGAAALGARLPRSGYAFPAAWALVCAVLMLVLDSGVWLSKFAAGATIALGLLAGPAVERAAAGRRSGALRVFLYAGLAAAAFASPMLVMAKYAFVDEPVTIRAEMMEVTDAIHADSDEAIPAVLTDCGTGVMLPGLGGVRVYCGHWALSDHNREKIMLLKSRLGLRTPREAGLTIAGVSKEDIDRESARLAAQLDAGEFGYLVVQTPYDLTAELRRAVPASCVVHDADAYLVVRMCPSVSALLTSKLP